MDAIDVVSHVNDILNCNLSDEEKISRIQSEVDEYFEELVGDEE